MAAPNPSQAPFSVTGKRAIITGAGSGINFEFAKLLLSKGCSVVIGDLALRPESEALIEQYSNSPPTSDSADSPEPPRAVFHRTDVTNWTSLQWLFDATVKEFGTFDILCPGAGVFEEHWSNFWYPPGSPESKDPITGHGEHHTGTYKTLDINITHPIRATQLAISEFLSPSDGSPGAPATPKRIVHVVSISAQMAVLPVPLYIASKHALDGFVRSLAPLDEALGIRINGVQPGIVRTPLWLEHPEKQMMVDERQDAWVEPKDVAQAMLRCIEDPGLGGGVMLEVGHGQTRLVPLMGNEGPSGKGHTVSAAEQKGREVFEWLATPGWGKSKGVPD